MAEIRRHPDSSWFLRDGPLVPQQVEDPSTMEESPAYKRMVEMGRHAKDELGTFWDWLKNAGGGSDTADPQKEFTTLPAEQAPPIPVPRPTPPAAFTQQPATPDATPQSGIAGLLDPYLETAAGLLPEARGDNKYLDELYALEKADKDRLKRDMTTNLLFGIASAPTSNPWESIGYGGALAMQTKEAGMQRYRQALGLMAKHTDEQYSRAEQRKIKEAELALQLLGANQKTGNSGREYLEKAFLDRLSELMKKETLTPEEVAERDRLWNEALRAGLISSQTGVPVTGGGFDVSD